MAPYLIWFWKQNLVSSSIFFIPTQNNPFEIHACLKNHPTKMRKAKKSTVYRLSSSSFSLFHCLLTGSIFLVCLPYYVTQTSGSQTEIHLNMRKIIKMALKLISILYIWYCTDHSFFFILKSNFSYNLYTPTVYTDFADKTVLIYLPI